MADKEVTKEDALKILQKEQAERIEACQKEVQEVLDKHNCVLDYRPQITIVPKRVN